MATHCATTRLRVDRAKASACLLAAYAEWFPVGTVFLCVVDPGVGGASPAIIILQADSRWYRIPTGLLISRESRVR